MKNNKDKTPVDESVLEETPPDINEPQPKEEEPKEEPETPETPDVPETPVVEPPEVPTPPVKPEETQEEKDRRYKAQQTEAQIQRAKAEALKNKVKEAAKISEPTEDEMRAFVNAKGASWDDLTPFEQATQK
jgi:hypothetical protein